MDIMMIVLFGICIVFQAIVLIKVYADIVKPWNILVARAEEYSKIPVIKPWIRLEK